jgi:hypothetical protein
MPQSRLRESYLCGPFLPQFTEDCYVQQLGFQVFIGRGEQMTFDWPTVSKLVAFACFALASVGLLPRHPKWMLWLFATAGIQFVDQMSGRDSPSAIFLAASQLDTFTFFMSALHLARMKSPSRWTFVITFIITVYIRNEWHLTFFQQVDIATCLLAGVFWGIVFAKTAWRRTRAVALIGGIGAILWGLATLALYVPEETLLYQLSGIGLDGGAVATFVAASLYNWFHDTPDENNGDQVMHLREKTV